MKKLISLFFTLTFIVALVGCGKTEQQQITVYSFSGENEQFSISNGVIVLSNAEEIFCGGDLSIDEDFFSNISSCSTTFYIDSNGEKKTILSNSVVDMTGGSVNFAGDLGQGSVDGVLIGTKIDNTNDWKNNLYFELTTTDIDGVENVYQLQMSLTEVTRETTDVEKKTDN